MFWSLRRVGGVRLRQTHGLAFRLQDDLLVQGVSHRFNHLWYDSNHPAFHFVRMHQITTSSSDSSTHAYRFQNQRQLCPSLQILPRARQQYICLWYCACSLISTCEAREPGTCALAMATAPQEDNTGLPEWFASTLERVATTLREHFELSTLVTTTTTTVS